MVKKLVVGVDGQDGGSDAIALARMLASEDTELTLAYVYRRESVAWRGASAAFEAAERERAGELLRQAREQASVQAELHAHGAPSVGRGLHELAEAIGADLLVVGSSRRGLLGRALIGDDTRAALNGAPCAIAIAPAGFAQTPALMREIGVGYDGSPESKHALGVARGIAEQHGAKLSAFEAVAIPIYLFTAHIPEDEISIDELVEAARDRVAAIADVEPHAAYGDPADELALYSASLDLLVIGSRSYGPMGRLVHGSVAQQLARTARCPLLVLTRAARETRAGATSAVDPGRAALGGNG